MEEASDVSGMIKSIFLQPPLSPDWVEHVVGREFPVLSRRGLPRGHWCLLLSPVDLICFYLFRPCVIMIELLELPQSKTEKQMLNAGHEHAGACQATVSGNMLLYKAGHIEAMVEQWREGIPCLLLHLELYSLSKLWAWLPTLLQEMLYTSMTSL